jgi:hypothetical protein
MGCLPFTAATTQYDRGYLDVSPGTDRPAVPAKYGEPDSKRQLDGHEVDIYESGDGPKPGDRAKSIASAIAFDAFTLGILEIGMIPEMCRALSGHASYSVFTITYSADDKVLSETKETRQSLIEPRQRGRCY